MPEWGHLPIPAKLLRQGVTDLGPDLRRADERHLVRGRRPPRRAGVGGRRPAGARRDGDRIRLDVAERRLDLVVDEEELEARRARLGAARAQRRARLSRLYADHVLQANEGCDFDFLRGAPPVVADAVTYLG